MLSMSSGFRSITALLVTVPAWEPSVRCDELSMGVPSTTNSGCVPPTMEAAPRIRM